MATVGDAEEKIEVVSFNSHFEMFSRNLWSNENSISREKVDFVREKMQIKMKGDGAPNIMLSFQTSVLCEQLRKNLKEHGYVSPTPVQMQVIPEALRGKDLLVSATTGSGKTASFLIPIIQKIYKSIGSLGRTHAFCKHPIALILSPTRELSIQIEEQAKQLSLSIPNFQTALLIGGNPLPQQLHRLRHKNQLIVATPGRLNDILDNHSDLLRLDQIRIVVIDEVDIMLQMGFQAQIQLITGALLLKPQYMMFSATIPQSIESMMDKIGHDPVFVCVGPSGLPNAHVKQLILWVEDISKKKKFFSLIEDGKHFCPPLVVFVESKLGADMLCEALINKFRFQCVSIHSDKNQYERTDILQKFLAGVYDILVSTNLMARGIDLINVRQVIIFDMPKSVNDYVHQVGRAGRLQSAGYSIAFINNSSKNLFVDIIKLFEASGEKLPDEIIHSPHLVKQDLRKDKRPSKRSLENKVVSSQNLMDILTKKWKTP